MQTLSACLQFELGAVRCLGHVDAKQTEPGGIGLIDLYTWKTSNCLKVNIAIAELDLPVNLHPVDTSSGAQKSAEYLALNPNGKVPMIVDADAGVTLFESGAILLYLADVTGRLMPRDRPGRWAATQWLIWQMAGIGPVGGQLGHFRQDPARGDYALERFRAEYDRLLNVLEGALGRADYLAGDYSMADIAVWPWLSRYGRHGVDLTRFPNILRWYRAIAERPAVQRGFALLNAGNAIPIPA
jgi:GSH-dependent disulfide-bond oxidoreductase